MEVLSNTGLRRFLAYCERNIREVSMMLKKGSAVAKVGLMDVSVVTSTSEAGPLAS